MAIQQKLHTKLVQKLILTPSLQQAIKLLPMSTLELADLLNQEMVENPLLEEVPTEELQPAEQQQAEKPEAEKPRREDRHLGRRRLRVLLRRLPRRRLPVAHARRGQGAAADREHALDGQRRCPITCCGSCSMQTDDEQLREIGGAIIGNLDDDGYLVASVEEIAAMGEWPVGDVERALQHVQTLRSDRRRRARPAGVPAGCSSGTSGSRARRPRRSSPSTCGCCRTTRSRRSRASSG